jgi:hypothetical protein
MEKASRVAEVKIDSKLLERLADGKEVVVNLPKGVSKLLITMDKEDDFAHFDRVFRKIWNRLLKRLELQEK